MHYSSDEIFDLVYLTSDKTVNKELIVDDLLNQCETLKPYILLENPTFEVLINLSVNTLAEIYIMQSEFFAIRFFMEVNKPLPPTNLSTKNLL